MQQSFGNRGYELFAIFHLYQLLPICVLGSFFPRMSILTFSMYFVQSCAASHRNRKHCRCLVFENTNAAFGDGLLYLYLIWWTILYYSPIMLYLARARGPHAAHAWFSVMMSLLFGSQFIKSPCHWWNKNLYIPFCYQLRQIFCFHDSKSIKSSFANVCCYRRKYNLHSLVDKFG
jgi:hypothetical protein